MFRIYNLEELEQRDDESYLLLDKEGNNKAKKIKIKDISREFLYSNALKGNISGELINITDISPLSHELKVKINAEDGVDLTKIKVFKNGESLLSEVKAKPLSTITIDNAVFLKKGNYMLSIKHIEHSETVAKWRMYIKVYDKNGNYINYGDVSSSDDIGTFHWSDSAGVLRGFWQSTDGSFIMGDRCTVFDNFELSIKNLKDDCYIAFFIGDLFTAENSYLSINNYDLNIYGVSLEEKIEYTPLSNGIVEGVTSVYPETVMYTDTEGTTLNVEYNKDINQTAEDKANKISEITDDNKSNVTYYPNNKAITEYVDNAISDSYNTFNSLDEANIYIAENPDKVKQGQVFHIMRDFETLSYDIYHYTAGQLELYYPQTAVTSKEVDTKVTKALQPLESDINELTTTIELKQNTLIDGETIRTINGESVLGNGNIVITSDSTIVIDHIYDSESENPQSGKAVAEAITEVFDLSTTGCFTPSVELENGNIKSSTNELVDSGNRIRFKNYIDVENFSISYSLPDNISMFLWEFKEDKTFNTSKGWFKNQGKLIPKKDSKYIKMTFHKNNQAMTVDDLNGFILTLSSQIEENVESLQSLTTEIDNRFEYVYTNNRYDASKATLGYVMDINGVVSYNANYLYTDFIPVSEGEVISIQYNNSTKGRVFTYIGFITAYDSEKNIIPESGKNAAYEDYSYTVPSGVSYIICSIQSNMRDVAIVNSEEIVPYEPYCYTYLKDEHINIDKIIKTTEIPFSSLDVIECQNLYDKDSPDIQEGKFGWVGSLSDNASYLVTGLIPVKPDTDYAFYSSHDIKGARGIEQFDKYKNYITGASTSNVDTIKTLSNTHYIRVTFYKSVRNKATIVEGTTPIPGVEHEYLLPSKYIKPSADSINAYLPSDLYCAVGRTIELYNNQVCLQANKYHFAWSCTVGKALSRKFSITGTENLIGDYTLSLSILDDNLKVVWSGNTNLHIVSNVLSNNYSICPIGDSLTNIKAWLPEVVNLSDDKINYVGSYTTTLKDADGNSKAIGHEGRSGFSAKNYIDGAIYNYGGETAPNVFWDGTRFNWNHYKAQTGLNPNCVQIFLGTNGMSNDNTTNAGYIKQMVDYIRQDDSEIPIFIVNTIYRGTQNGIGVQQSNDGYASAVGVYKYSEDKKVMDLMQKLDTLFAEGYTNVFMINLALTHDSEYNFGAVETSVNPRAVQKEFMPIESIHPQAQGYYQMADVMFSVYCGCLNN